MWSVVIRYQDGKGEWFELRQTEARRLFEALVHTLDGETVRSVELVNGKGTIINESAI